jgi:signal transduction histidine kinase
MARWLALRRFLAHHVEVVDGPLALALGVATAFGSADAAADAGPHASPMDALGYGLVAATAAGLVVRRRFPVPAFVVSFGSTLAFLLLRYPYGPIIQLTAVTIYSVAAWRPLRTSAAVCGTGLAIYVPIGVWGLGTVAAADDVVVTFAWLVLPWLAGLAARAFRAARAQVTAAERQRHGYEERLRIAKEVHDVVGHGLTVISMQAGVALHVLEDRSDPVAEALRAIRATSGQALDELRATLATFPDGRRPTPGLDRVAGLVDAVRSDRLSVELVVDGDRGRVPAAVDLAGYRIVQESLTNVVRHAAARHATVRVVYEPTALRLAVTDDGRGCPAGDLASASGQGLAGMRERVLALGGAVEAGSPGDGGFEVRAVLPYREAREATRGRW